MFRRVSAIRGLVHREQQRSNECADRERLPVEVEPISEHDRNDGQRQQEDGDAHDGERGDRTPSPLAVRFQRRAVRVSTVRAQYAIPRIAST